jgi:hypothetical protein
MLCRNKKIIQSNLLTIFIISISKGAEVDKRYCSICFPHLESLYRLDEDYIKILSDTLIPEIVWSWEDLKLILMRNIKIKIKTFIKADKQNSFSLVSENYTLQNTK